MKRFVVSGALSALVLAGVMCGMSSPADARGRGHGGWSHGSWGHGGWNYGGWSHRGGHTHLSLSLAFPLGYYGAYGWDAPIYRPHYYGYNAYYAPRPVYRPAYRPAYRSSYGSLGGPIYSLGLFPTFVGDQLTAADRQVYATAYRRALEAPVGEGMAWDSGAASGQIITTRDGWAGSRYCREFRQDVTIGDRTQEAYGTACRTPNGDWQLVQNQ